MLLGVGKESGGVPSQLASPARVPRRCQSPSGKCPEGPRGNHSIPDEYERQIRETPE